jgi:CHAT domain-containing protein
MSSVSRSIAVVLLLAGATAVAVDVHARRASYVDRLSAARPARTFLPRLSIDGEYRRCDAAPGSGHIPVGRCEGAAGDQSRLKELSTEIAAAVRTKITSGTLHARALKDLLGGPGKIDLDTAIASLESAARMSDHPARILGDLAAAYLLRAELTQSPYDAARAIDEAEHARELDPRSPAILFNRSLALESWALDSDAAAAWRDYLAVDASSDWADEARRHLQALSSRPAPPPPPALDATDGEVRDFAVRYPQEAREYGWDDLLGRWADAVLRGDGHGTAAPLRLAGALGDALEAAGRDATLADAARAIRARSGDAAALRVLARGHVAYARARRAMDDVEYDTATKYFREALELHPPSPVLEAWARQGYAAGLTNNQLLDSARQVLRPLDGRIDQHRWPVLAARVLWTKATIELRENHPDAVLGPARSASALLLASGETAIAAGARYVAGDAESSLGAVFSAYGTAREALWYVRAHPGSVWRCNALAAAARAMLAEGLARTALRLQDERVDAARLNGHPGYLAEALAARAQMRAAAGDTAGALRDAQVGDRALNRVGPGSPDQKLRGDLQIARAQAYLPSDPARAAATADSMMSDTVTASGYGSKRLFQALIVRARARLSLGDEERASADLDSATRVLIPNRANVLSVPLRISLFESARAAFDQLVMLRLARGDTAGALRYLERGRVSLAWRGATARADGMAPPAGVVVLDYALIGDTLLAWAIGSGRPWMVRATVSRADLVARIEQLNLRLERGDPEAAVRPELTRLFDELVRRLGDRLGRSGSRMVIVADGELDAIPFAALFDRHTGRYLFEDHVIAYAPSLADASAPRRPPAIPTWIAITANPAYDLKAYPGLEPLSWATAEADSIARLYPRAAVDSGAAATRSAVQAALRGAEVFHFTGHALFDAAQPEHSALVLASAPGAPTPRPLTAADLDSMDLRRTRLVVLSACETMRASAGRGSAFAGFAAAFLGAGAGGVVGGSWLIDDAASNRLMVEFHRAYRATGDGAASLQAAQIKLLHSRQPGLATPSAWAAFRYAGN